ncbi:MAG: hypothetical protein K6G38_06085 [Gammaproteobacteria bacterium]|nr:hypothetical protein [Gammaproteobacteria bacterium]
MKRKLLTAGQVLNYVFTFIYALVSALFYSVSEKIYWLFIVFGLIALCVGLYTETIKTRLLESTELSKKDKIILIVFSVLSIISCPACLLYLLALLNKEDNKYKTTVNPDYKPIEKKERKWYFKTSFILVCLSFILIFVFSIVASTVETSGGKVKVTDYTLTKKETDLYNRNQPINGVSFTIDDPSVYYSFTEYRPKDASMTNLAPVVFVLPGFTRTKATMSQYALELSRRGAVVYTIDPGSQGASSYGGYQADENGEYILDENGNKTQNSYNVARSGLGYLLQYVYNNIDKFNYIDRDKIGVVGHSAGGGDATKLASDFAGATYEESIIKALYISGYIKTSAANLFYKLRCNTALSYAKYDEGAFRYQDENQAYEVIALRFINEVNSKTSSANGHFDYFIQDYEYGNMANGTYRVVHHEDINHCFEMYDPISIANTFNFFSQAFALDKTIADTDQVWFVKEASNGLALVSAFILIIALVYVVIEFVPFMKPLNEEAKVRLEEEKLIRLAYSNNLYIREKGGVEHKEKTFLKRVLFFIPTILTAIIACLDFVPLARLSMDLFPDAAGNVYTAFFPERMMNSVFLWALFNGALGLVIWVLTTAIENLIYLISGQKEKIDWSKFKGLKVKPSNLLKSLGLAVILFFTFYGVLEIVYLITHQDFRFMLISASPLNKRMFVTWLIYIAGFYVFYVSNSIRVNLTVAREGYKEWQVLTISALANSLGLVFIIIINYWVYFKTGTVFYGYYSASDQSEMWLYINMVFGLIPMMAILPIFNRLAYKKMGNVYSGALLWCMIFIMMSLSASISFIPM